MFLAGILNQFNFLSLWRIFQSCNSTPFYIFEKLKMFAKPPIRALDISGILTFLSRSILEPFVVFANQVDGTPCSA